MFLFIFIVTGVILEAASKIPHINTDIEDKIQLERCNAGDIVENECNKCICTQRYIYECKSKVCKKIKASRENLKRSLCQPYKIYNQLTTICICKPNGRWPHQACVDTFRSLPRSQILKPQCAPNSYIHVDCNVCWCDEDGQVDTNRCTKNNCDRKFKADRRRNTISSKVFGDCSANQWYSLAPCQFCYCLTNNKLMCNTGNYNRQSLQLGLYNFTQCGTDLLKEILELVPEGKTAASALIKGGSKSTPMRHAPTTKANEHDPKSDVDYEEQSSPDKIREEHQDPVQERDDSPEKSSKESFEVGSKKELLRVRDDNDVSTKLPFDDDNNNRHAARGRTEDSSSDTDDEKLTKATTTTSTTAEASEGSFLSALIPSVLGKMFNMRKTVVLDPKTKCEPDSQFTVKCNHCFCLKNGKLMCTNNTCT